MLDPTLQEAKAMCDTCPVDPKFWLPEFLKVTMKKGQDQTHFLAGARDKCPSSQDEPLVHNHLASCRPFPEFSGFLAHGRMGTF